MRYHALRLKRGQDLKISILQFVFKNRIKAAFIVTCVGSLEKSRLRMADENISKEFDKKFEIVSLVGTLCPDGVHLHISLSDAKGVTIGGHLQEGCIIYTTAEIIIGELEGLKFSRVFDKNTGFKELFIG
ncbi:DNA-binding protein [Candidatus Woesearchaeota archaeon]|nr:DNA-binding protein [Candidatus Woesearchaeota archaeon]